MNKMHPSSFLVLVASLFLTATLSAQETKVTVKMERDGKTVKDTTYTFDEADQAQHAMKMMEIMSADDELLMEIHEAMAGLHEGHSTSYVFITKDGEKTEIKKITGDKDMNHKVESGDHAHGEHVKVIKSGECVTHDILMDQDSVHSKKITVVVSDGEDGEWEIITNDEQEIETEAIMKEHGVGESEEVEVIIVKKKVKSEKQ